MVFKCCDKRNHVPLPRASDGFRGQGLLPGLPWSPFWLASRVQASLELYLHLTSLPGTFLLESHPNCVQRANTFPLLCYCFFHRFSFTAAHQYSIPYFKIPQEEKTVGFIVLSLELSEDAPVCCDREGTQPLAYRLKPWGADGPLSMQPVDRLAAQIQQTLKNQSNRATGQGK